jgi:hypothetical protein
MAKTITADMFRGFFSRVRNIALGQRGKELPDFVFWVAFSGIFPWGNHASLSQAP